MQRLRLGFPVRHYIRNASAARRIYFCQFFQEVVKGRLAARDKSFRSRRRVADEDRRVMILVHRREPRVIL